MADNKFQNKAEELGGKAKETFGKATGNDEAKHEGKADQTKADAKEKANEAGDKVQDKANEALGSFQDKKDGNK